MNPLLVRPAAARDIEDAFDWYEGQRPGLGNEFLDELRATFERIAQNPQLFQIVHRKTHRAFLRRFPYGVFYRADVTAILVVAVMHVRRAPRRWQVRR